MEKTNPEQYEDWYNSPKGKFVDLLEKEVIADLTQVIPGQKVLEIGCGTGHFSDFFKTLGADVTGLDTSYKMLDVARSRCGNKQIEFNSGDACYLPFKDDSFDLVAMITVLEFIKDPKKALEEAFRVSKGQVFLGILNKFSYLAYKRKKSSKELWKQAKFYSISDILKLLNECKQIKCRAVIYLPLVNSNKLVKIRILIENCLSWLRMPGGAFVGMIAQK